MSAAEVAERHVVRVDRSNSVLGNRFFRGTRDQNCDAYRDWLREMLRQRNGKVMRELQRLVEIYKREGRLTLACWCVPLRCHSEYVKKAVEWLTDREGGIEHD